MDLEQCYFDQSDEREKANNNHIDAIENLILVKEIEKENVNLKISERPTSPEESIYETTSDHLESEFSEKDLNSNLNFTYSPTEKKLCFIGNDATAIPTEIIDQFGLKTLVLDISFNCISDLKDLEQFPHLEELICDNNFISEDSNFPRLVNLKLFSCNKNSIENIHVFIEKIKVQFPNITYLTMLGNLACPNQLVDSSKDEYDYSRYRKYVLHSLRKLRFLDCYEITDYEKDIIQKESHFFDVITYKENGSASKSNSESLQKYENWTPLPPSKAIEVESEAKTKSTFGYCKYIYHGKQSEGNRFIKNDDL